MGPSGGGKSTVAKLIARFWDVTSGEITIGGVRLYKRFTEIREKAEGWRIQGM